MPRPELADPAPAAPTGLAPTGGRPPIEGSDPSSGDQSWPAWIGQQALGVGRGIAKTGVGLAYPDPSMLGDPAGPIAKWAASDDPDTAIPEEVGRALPYFLDFPVGIERGTVALANKALTANPAMWQKLASHIGVDNALKVIRKLRGAAKAAGRTGEALVKGAIGGKSAEPDKPYEGMLVGGPTASAADVGKRAFGRLAAKHPWAAHGIGFGVGAKAVDELAPRGGDDYSVRHMIGYPLALSLAALASGIARRPAMTGELASRAYRAFQEDQNGE